jgi:hypothetical protein
VKTLCSTIRTEPKYAGSSVTQARELLLMVVDPDTQAVVCQTTKNIRSSLMADRHAINLNSCPELKGKKYWLNITDPEHHSKGFFYNTEMVNQGDFTPMSAITIKRSYWTNRFEVDATWHTIYVLYGKNPKISDTDDNVSCDEDASPLVVDTGNWIDSGHGLPLSSPAQGVQFDILGARAKPVPHAKRQISWFKDPRFMFIVLPDKNGNVNGIDQMFGNNTVGPDGKFAANGYKALAKHDWNRDGVINRWDPVYYQLRLWSDINADGVAQPNELYSLERMGITSIHLKYSHHFSEEDAYGNQTRYRSKVTYKDGKTSKTYDVWFAIH